MLAGAAFSVVLAFAIRTVLRSVDPANPVAFGAVPLLIAFVALVATLIPTWRLLREAPMSILSER